MAAAPPERVASESGSVAPPAAREDPNTVLVAAGMCLARVVPPAAETIKPNAAAVLATLGERLDLPPTGVVADLGALLFGATLDRLRTSALPVDDPALAASVRRYEDAVLGRLAVDGRLATAGYAVARLPPEMHALAIGILVAGVLSRMQYDAGIEIKPGVVRALGARSGTETLARGAAALREDAALRETLAQGYAALARSAQKVRDLIGDADLFALENLTVLGSLTQRLAIADVLRAQEAIGAGVPKRIPRLRRKEGSLATKLEDESEYPVGGFSSVSTSGSLENLVSSELIYMDPPSKSAGKAPSGGPRRADVDLFDMRYVEGELLYYTRDEAIFVRQRREITLTLAPDLIRARVKDRGLPSQRIVMLLGFILVLTKKVFELLGEEALTLEIVFLEDGGRTPLEDERGLAALMLREWIDRGMAAISTAPESAVAERVAKGVKRALVEVIRFGAAAGPAKAPLDPRAVVVDMHAFPETLDGWTAKATEILAAIL